MLTPRAAATLLADAGDITALARIAALAGCAGSPAPLDADARRSLGIPDDIVEAHVAAGDGALRALLVRTRPGTLGRDLLARCARRLASRTPHLLWLVVAAEGESAAPTASVAVAAWDAGTVPPRVAALLCDRRRVVASDAETLRLLAVSHGEAADVLVHARWLESLGREAVTRRFFRALAGAVARMAEGAGGRAPIEARRRIALLHASRLLFLSFLEAKGWLDGDRAWLSHSFERCVSGAGGYHRRVLRPLLFGTLNTTPSRRAAAARALGRIPFLNGGLFALSAVERAHPDLELPDDALGGLFDDVLSRYRFTAREGADAWSEAAVDPEMLGRAFESLMAAAERRASGTFFTPQPLVARVTDAALREALAGAADQHDVDAVLRGEARDGDAARSLRQRLASLRVLDPACGSGAFLVHTLERLADALALAGDERPVAERRRALLASSIFGVDRDPTAVWLCELRLWLSVVIESEERDPLAVPPLPNLDRHVRVGDALAPGGVGGRGLLLSRARRVAELRSRYVRATGTRKRTLSAALEREERAAALADIDAEIARVTSLRRDLLSMARSRDLFGNRSATRAAAAALAQHRATARELRARRRRLVEGGALPFSFATHFPDAAASGGFDVVLANPPWVRLHHIPPREREALRREFAVFRDAAWARGAAIAGAGPGFGAQADLSALFAERALEVVREGGVAALLVPVKLWRALAGGGLRRVVAERHSLVRVEDWSEAPHAFDAAVYPGLLVVRRGTSESSPPVRVAVRRRGDELAWCAEPGTLAFDRSPGSPWLLLPPPVRRAFDRLAASGPPLAECAFGRPTLGAKCGLNEAFVVELGPPSPARDGTLDTVSSAGRTGTVERAMLRPVLRGEHVAPWRAPRTSERIVWCHDASGRPLASPPEHAARWLGRWRRQLLARTDRGSAPWWSLFRLDGAAPHRPRVVWADVARVPRALVLAAGDDTVPLNTCYVLRCTEDDDAHALAALLNSPLAAAWLGALAEPARGGFRRYLAWTVGLLPIPAEWERARALLAPLGREGAREGVVAEERLLRATLAAYRVRRETVEPLLSWSIR